MFNLDAVPERLLTTSNPKTAKGQTHGYLTAVMHFAPAHLSGANVCQHASPGCVAVCLNTAGHGGIGLDRDGLNRPQAARIQRTRFFRRDQPAFWAMLERDLRAHLRRAQRLGLKAAVRLNATSDLPWERFTATISGRPYVNVMRAFPEIIFYDYTKIPLGMRGERRSQTLPDNYSLTFSLSESNEEHARTALESGVNVAVVFAPQRSIWPEHFMGRSVIDGDLHDLRFLDPPGVIVGLRAKGRARHDRSGFVHSI